MPPYVHVKHDLRRILFPLLRSLLQLGSACSRTQLHSNTLPLCKNSWPQSHLDTRWHTRALTDSHFPMQAELKQSLLLVNNGMRKWFGGGEAVFIVLRLLKLYTILLIMTSACWHLAGNKGAFCRMRGAPGVYVCPCARARVHFQVFPGTE